MRVIAGEYKGRKLKSVPGTDTRPTTDKVKESLFNIIGPYFDGGWCLDLFAGSGSLGIEAVSRGSEKAVLFERSRKAVAAVKENIAVTKEPERFEIFSGDARKNLKQFAKANPAVQFSIVFIDPPYAEEQTETDIRLMLELNLVNADTVFVCEMAKENELPDQISSFSKTKRALYGTTAIEIFETSYF